MIWLSHLATLDSNGPLGWPADGDLGAGEVPTRQHGATHSHQWAPCERRVRQILLGHPQAARLAKMPPEWVR